jgi:hypothetical protein
MSTFLFGLLLVIGLVWGIPFIVSRLFGEQAGKRVTTGLFVILCVLFLGAVWFIYGASSEQQLKGIEKALGGWGLITEMVKWVLSATIFWTVFGVWRWAVKVQNNWAFTAKVAALAWSVLAIPCGLWLVLKGAVDIFA